MNCSLRPVVDEDLPLFFAHQLDATANHMAAFVGEDPENRDRFMAHWQNLRANPTIVPRTILCGAQVVGHILSYEEEGKDEVNQTRPIFARVAKDNIGSRRVLEKCGFVVIGEARGYANAREAEIEELLLQLG